MNFDSRPLLIYPPLTRLGRTNINTKYDAEDILYRETSFTNEIKSCQFFKNALLNLHPIFPGLVIGMSHGLRKRSEVFPHTDIVNGTISCYAQHLYLPTIIDPGYLAVISRRYGNNHFFMTPLLFGKEIRVTKYLYMLCIYIDGTNIVLCDMIRLKSFGSYCFMAYQPLLVI